MNPVDAIAIIENEKECVHRASENRCDRDCYHCDLVKPDTEILEAMDMAIGAIKQTILYCNSYMCSLSKSCAECPVIHKGDCENCNHYGVFSLDCSRCDDERSKYEPKQRTGHWILLDNCSNAGYYCSECHKKVVKEGWSETVKTIKFCPNCGVPLEGVEYR